MAGIGQHANDIFFVRGIHGIVGGLACIPETKSIMVFGRYADIFHARFFKQVEPLTGIKFDRVPVLSQFYILFPWNAAPPLMLDRKSVV